MADTGSKGSLARRPALLAVALVAIGIATMVALAEGPSLVRGGLHPCVRLDERVCRDLGAVSCAIWRERLGGRGTGSTQPLHPRRNRTVVVDVVRHWIFGWNPRTEDNPLCYDELHPTVYPQILAAIRGSVFTEQERASLTRPSRSAPPSPRGSSH